MDPVTTSAFFFFSIPSVPYCLPPAPPIRPCPRVLPHPFLFFLVPPFSSICLSILPCTCSSCSPTSLMFLLLRHYFSFFSLPLLLLLYPSSSFSIIFILLPYVPVPPLLPLSLFLYSSPLFLLPLRPCSSSYTSVLSSFPSLVSQFLLLLRVCLCACLSVPVPPTQPLFPPFSLQFQFSSSLHPSHPLFLLLPFCLCSSSSYIPVPSRPFLFPPPPPLHLTRHFAFIHFPGSSSSPSSSVPSPPQSLLLPLFLFLLLLLHPSVPYPSS